MTFTPEVAAVNQQIQLGVETTWGTAVACNKLIKALDIVPAISGQTTPYTPSGNRYVSVQEQDWEESSFAINGILDFNTLAYLLSSAYGIITPALNGSSATAYKWQATPPITGPSVQRQSYSFQQGDSVRARSATSLLLNAFGYKWTPKTSPMLSGVTAFGLPIADAITLTASPTAVTLAPITDLQFKYYLDLTSAGIGTTGLTRLFSVDYAFGNIGGPFYASNRSSIGPSGNVDLPPKTSIKLLLETDAIGLAAMLSYYHSQQTIYFRAQAVGAVIDNLQVVTLGTQSSGTFTLTYKAQTTTTIAYNATAATVQTALIALSTIGASNVTVSGSAGGPYSIIFPQTGTLGQDTTAITANFASLTTPGNASINSTAQSSNTFTHDMALKAAKPNAFADNQGIYAVEWELTVVQDPAWGSGQAQQLTLINLLSAL